MADAVHEEAADYAAEEVEAVYHGLMVVAKQLVSDFFEQVFWVKDGEGSSNWLTP